MWKDGFKRTNADYLRTKIEENLIIIASYDGKIVGVVEVEADEKNKIG